MKIKYKLDGKKNGPCTTMCPHEPLKPSTAYMRPKVGSIYCQKCKYNAGTDKKGQIVTCNK